jgi:hypothetical protein
MSYEIGTTIDISHVNRQRPVEKKISVAQKAGHYYDIGTAFVFRMVDGQYRAAIRIPVLVA